MGCPKALMKIGSRSWWEIQADRLDSIEMASVWVVSSEVQRGLGSEGKSQISTLCADSGLPMFESLVAGLESVGTEECTGLFVLPVDVPVPVGNVFEALRATEQVSVPTFKKRRGHPVYLPMDWIQSINWNHLPEGLRRLDRLIASDVVEVPVDDPDTVVDLDTPEDVQRWLDQNERECS